MKYRNRVVLRLAVVGMVWIAAPAMGDTRWTRSPASGSGAWTTASNWDAGIPDGADYAYVNTGGTAAITAAGAVCDRLRLGQAAAESGTVLIGSGGQLSAMSAFVGESGAGWLAQSGGSCTLTSSLVVGGYALGRGTYELDGGRLSSQDQYVGYGYNGSGTGTWATGSFYHSGGTNVGARNLYLAYYAAATGSYALSGAGTLSAKREYVGYGGTANLIQTGGSNTVGYLSINSPSTYVLDGGVLQVGNGCVNRGTLDFAAGSAAVQVASAIVDLTGGHIVNAAGASLTLGPQSLLIVSPGDDPSTVFGSFSTQGLVHAAGTTLTIAADQGVAGTGEITDHVACAGTIAATPGESITLHDGLSLTGSGSADLGDHGLLYVKDAASGLAGSGSLSASSEAIGYGAAGTFTQDGGSNTCNRVNLGDNGGAGTYTLSGGTLTAHERLETGSGTGTFLMNGGSLAVGDLISVDTFSLGHQAGSSASYDLAGGVRLGATVLYIGHGGHGTLTQTDANNYADTVCLGYADGATGEYTLGGLSLLDTTQLVIGQGGQGRMTQTGGTADIFGYLYLGKDPSSHGSYTLQGGLLSSDILYAGCAGEGTFVQTGGSNQCNGLSVGELAGAVGQFELSGADSRLSIGNLEVGDTGRGSFVQAGGLVEASNYLGLGSGPGSQGVYTMSGGTVTSASVYVGFEGSGQWVQSGLASSVVLTSSLDLGDRAGSWGIYDLSGGRLTAASLLAGAGGSGAFANAGGTSLISGDVSVGYAAGSNGSCALSAAGTLSAKNLYVGRSGVGTLTHLGARSTVAGTLAVGMETGSAGTCVLGGSDSVVSALDVYVGRRGTGQLTQTDGLLAAGYKLYLGRYGGSDGKYDLGGGSLTAESGYVGYDGTGQVAQTGGGADVRYALYLGYGGTAAGSWTLSAGTLSVASYEYVGGFYGRGTVVQTAGTHTVGKTMYLGMFSGSVGSVRISGGNLTAGTLNVGYFQGRGTLEIGSAAANVTVSSLLSFGADSYLSAVPGAHIHMTGSQFTNSNTDPNKLAGLGDLELIFEGGSGTTDLFEVAGRDFGDVAEGFNLNFSLGALTLGGADVGRVKLVNLVDNQPAWSGNEALYVQHLTLGSGSYLDLNGLNLYYGQLTDLGGVVDLSHGGSLVYVPEPLTLVPLAWGAAVLVRRRQRVPSGGST